MQTLTYRQAYDKVIEAYFKDEIKPYHANFCFCGTIAPEEYITCKDGSRYKNWNTRFSDFRSEAHTYSAKEYAKMERALLEGLGCEFIEDFFLGRANGLNVVDDGYEESLFKGMCAALDVLKEIHRSRGENVDEEIPAFTKRVLKQLIQ